MRRLALFLAVFLTLPLPLSLLLLPPAAAQEPSSPCMAGVPSDPPVPTDEQARYRARLHALATGAGVRVAVIDTGVARSAELPRLESGPDFVAPDSPDPHLDCDIHGTVVAGLIGGQAAGLAPGATLISIRQSSAHYSRSREEQEGAGTLETLARALDAAVDAQAQVINVSVVACMPPAQAARLDTRPLDAALRRAEESGAVVVAASGNAGGGCEPGDVVYPSHGGTVVSVGALEAPRAAAAYSLPGDLAAPGLVPVGLGPEGWISGELSPGQARGESQPLVGTSFAAPVIAGTVALLRERHPTATAAELRALLQAAAQPGTGYLDPLAAVSARPAHYSAAPRAGRLSIAGVAGASPAAGRLGLLLSGLLVAALCGALVAAPRR